MSSDSPDPAARARAAADVLKAAIDRHFDACATRGGESDPVVQEAYDLLREAAESYDNALFDAFEEVTPFEFADAPDSVRGDADVEEVPRRIGLYVRRDYAVRDLDELLAGARAASAQSWPEDAGPAPVEEVTSAGRAVYELLNTHGVDGLDDLAEDAGLEPVGGTMWVLAEDETDDSLYDGPFDDVDADRLLYRLDEVFEG